jgi:hypothetical protein
MLLWDPDHSIPFNDVIEMQGAPTKILAIQMRSKSQLVKINLTTTQSFRGNQAVNHPKPIFSSKNNLTNIHTWEMPKIDYNIGEYLKKMKANMFVMDMCKIPQQKDFLLQALKLTDTSMTNINQGDAPSPIDLKNKLNVNACSLDKERMHFFLFSS